jgi:glycosyltransferase involved in cell wall biosynthesis
MMVPGQRRPQDLATGRVLFGTDFGGWGGGERKLLEYACALTDRGWGVALLSPEGELRRKAQAADVPAYLWPPRASWTSLGALMDEISPDVIHLMSYGRRTRLCANVAGSRRILMILSVSALAFPRGIRSRRFVRQAAAVLAASETVRKELLASGVRVRHLETIPHIPGNAARMRPERPPFAADSKRGTVVGWVGRLDPVKRLEDAIKAFAAFRDTNPESILRVAAAECSYGDVGTQEYARHVRATAQALGVAPSIEFRIDEEDIGGFLNSIDIFISSSERETFSRSVFEAMLMARPIVATRARAVSDLISDGVDGLLVNVGDVEGLAAGLRALTNDRDQARVLGRAARERATRIAAESDPVTSLERVLRRVLDRNQGKELL